MRSLSLVHPESWEHIRASTEESAEECHFLTIVGWSGGLKRDWLLPRTPGVAACLQLSLKFLDSVPYLLLLRMDIGEQRFLAGDFSLQSALGQLKHW